MAGEGHAVEQRLRAAVESAPSGLLMIDAEGHIVLVNREVERLFGYPREELLGKPVEMLVPERFRAEHPASRAGFLRAPRVRAMGAGRELFGLRKDGSELPVEIGLTPVATEEGCFVISSVVDVSARREAERARRALEEQLRQAQKMESLGRLAGGVAHDFNNILGAIVGYAELARQETTLAAAAADLDKVLESALRGRDLVDRILRFSRRQDIELRPVELGRVLKDVAGMLRATLPASVSVEVVVPPELPRVMADSTSVEQVVVNLANNATHAMPDGGRLRLGLEPFYARDHFVRVHQGLSEGSYVELRVEDSGHGMDAGTRDRAFEPFFTTKPPGAGSGLGLALVHGIVRDHAGAVWLESAVGEGTTVRCLFPVALDEAIAEVAVRRSLPRGSGETILFVDDEPTLVEVGARLLGSLGYRVVTATSPEQALTVAADVLAELDLVITDYSMPGMSGVELARALAELRADLPVLMASGYAGGFREGDIRAAGLQGLLPKPLRLADLAAGVARVLPPSRGGGSGSTDGEDG